VRHYTGDPGSTNERKHIMSDLKHEFALRFEHKAPTAEEGYEYKHALEQERLRTKANAWYVFLIAGIILGMIILRAFEYYWPADW
jgi:hypothetical protein